MAADFEDAKVHRCEGCGAWCYGAEECTTPTCIAASDPTLAAILAG